MHAFTCNSVIPFFILAIEADTKAQRLGFLVLPPAEVAVDRARVKYQQTIIIRNQQHIREFKIRRIVMYTEIIPMH